MEVLIIEDDLSIAELQRDYLEISGFTVSIELSGADGIRRALEQEFDLFIVDIMLPDANGFEICREIRKKKETPILVVSAKDSDIDKIRALGLGADDYMVKPFSPNELVARVQAHIARFSRLKESFGGSEQADNSEDKIILGELTMCFSSRTAHIAENEISLTNKEFDLLAMLAQNPNSVLSKDKILNKVWGIDAYIETATVAVHVNRLREKIEKDPSNPEHIQTVWGIGYRYIP